MNNTKNNPFRYPQRLSCRVCIFFGRRQNGSSTKVKLNFRIWIILVQNAFNWPHISNKKCSGFLQIRTALVVSP